MNAFTGRVLYLCTPIRRDLVSFVEAVILGGVDVVQLREKDASDREILAAARELSRLCDQHGVPFLVNDRADIALACDASGVHVGQEDLSVSTVRSLLGRDRVIGVSTHAQVEFIAELATDADYLSVGPVVPTPTKPGRAGTGLGYLRKTAQILDSRPRFITGGVNVDAIEELVNAGARRFVVVRALTEASNPREAALKLRRKIEHAIA
ncbi:MAG: thiamine phosphate synthase [Ferrimicrobium sp.]